jgi:hypothetical protein
MKQQFVVTHTIRQTDIPALPDSWITNIHSVKMLCPQKKKSLSINFRKNITKFDGSWYRIEILQPT